MQIRPQSWLRPHVPVRAQVFTASTIHTLSSTDHAAATSATALLEVGGQVAHVGTLADCRAAARDYGLTVYDVIDFGNRTVVPGFVDAHTHPLMLGQTLTWVDCSPAQARTIPEILALLRTRSAQLPDGTPVRGYGYEQKNLAEGRHPTRYELDQVARDREVYLMNASGHGGVVNSHTLQIHGINRDTPNPAGGEFFRDEQGELTGELADAACNVLTGTRGVKVGHHGPNLHLDDGSDQHRQYLHAAQREFLHNGVTSIGDAQVTRREFLNYRDVLERGELQVRVNMYLLSSQLDEVIDLGLGRFGNELLSVAGIKFYADGTLGGQTAYFPQGYLDDPCRHGQLYHSAAELAELIGRAHRAGLQCATHAQSPTAIGMVLDAVAAAQKDYPQRRPDHRIEHCGLPQPEQLAQMAELGVIPVVQTLHYRNWGDGVVEVLGERGVEFNPLGAMRSAGLDPVISSDTPVAAPHALAAIDTATTRQTVRGNVYGPTELLLTPEQALRAHTTQAATALGRTDIGNLGPGMRADFAVLSADPLTTPPGQISSITVDETWIAGQQAFATN